MKASEHIKKMESAVDIAKYIFQLIDEGDIKLTKKIFLEIRKFNTIATDLDSAENIEHELRATALRNEQERVWKKKIIISNS